MSNTESWAVLSSRAKSRDRVRSSGRIVGLTALTQKLQWDRSSTAKHPRPRATDGARSLRFSRDDGKRRQWSVIAMLSRKAGEGRSKRPGTALLAALVMMGFGTRALAHGERAQEPSLRLSTIQWYDTKWSSDQISVNQELTLSGRFRVMANWPLEIPSPAGLTFLNVGVPGPVFIRTASVVNGVNGVSSCGRVGGIWLLLKIPGQKNSVVLLLGVIVAVAICFAPAVAHAHGGGPGLDYDPCMRQAGADDFVHLTVYQPEFNPFAEYCGALPQSGGTLLVFDLMGLELPDAPVSLAVVQEGGAFRLSVPARRYRAGVVDLRAKLPPGKYTVLMSVDEPDGLHRLTFPLSVGAWWDRLVAPLVAVLLIGLTTAGYCVFQIRRLASDRGSPLMKNPIELVRRLT